MSLALRARARALAANLAVHGLAVIVRPPGVNAIPTKGIWLPNLTTEPGPMPGDIQRTRPRRVIAIPKSTPAAEVLAGVGVTASAVPVLAVDRGVVIDAEPAEGGAAVRWRVDEVDSAEADHFRVIVERL